jgi:hypothetical protein
MANRRKFLAGLGALASGSAAAVGTGAFTSANATRTATVQALGDPNGFLGMQPVDNDRASLNSNGEIEFDFQTGEGGNASGINANATTQFDSVFRLTNNGTEDIIFAIGSDGSRVFGPASGLPGVNGRTSNQDTLNLLGDAPGVDNVFARAANFDSGDDPFLSAGNSGYGVIGLDIGGNVVARDIPDSNNVTRNNGNIVSPFGGHKLLAPGESVTVDIVFETGNNPDFSTDKNLTVLATALSEDPANP